MASINMVKLCHVMIGGRQKGIFDEIIKRMYVSVMASIYNEASTYADIIRITSL